MRRIFLFLMILFQLSAALGTTQEGGNGLIYIQSARTIPKGHLQFFVGSKFFGKIASFGQGSQPYTLWNIQGFVSLNVGIGSHIELAISPILYQDTNTGLGNILDGQANLPDDIFVHLKIASFGALESPFLFGGMLSVRIPTAEVHNLIYEPYSAGDLEIGLKGMASYFSNTTFPDEGWSIHSNVGYWYHNDVGSILSHYGDLEQSVKPTNVSTEMLLGLGVKIPAGTFDFSAEVNSRFFLNRPPVNAYSREAQVFLTGGIYYKPYPWITIEMGMDFLLYAEEDMTAYGQLASPPADFPNYPPWRGVIGARLAILPTSLYDTSEKSLLRRKIDDRQQILERLMRGQTETRDAEGELERIRAARKKLEEDLQRLRRLLEQEEKKKKKKEGGEG